MDIRMETFFNLYQTMNYHETARQLHMTQPSVSQHIKSLEAEYGCRFFLYDHKKLSRTREAEIWESFARSIVYSTDKLRCCLQKPPIRSIRIGATKSIGEFMMTEMTARYLADFSRTAVITVDNTERLLELLDHNQLDFALVEGEFSKARYASRPFRREPLCGICARGHRLAGQTVQIEALFGETLILREPGSGTRGIFSHLLDSLGYSKDNFARTVTVSEFALLTGLVASGTGISFVYQAVAGHAPGVATFFIEGAEPAHDLHYVFLRDTVAEDLVGEFENA